MSRASIIFVGGLLLGVSAFLLADGLPGEDIAVASETSTTTTGPPPAPTTTSPARGELVIHGTGDVNPDTSYIPALAEHGHEHAWSGLGGLFQEDDLTVVNLECTPSALGEALDKEFVFRCDPGALPVMRDAGVEVANLANNHSGDHGPEALLDGRANLESSGVAPVGVGRDAAEATTPAIFELNGWRVAVLGFGGVVPAWGWLAGEERPGMADGDTTETMVAAVEAASARADLVVVTIHWGVERDQKPRSEDRERAQALVEAGADVIFGHHPHRLQPLEMVEGAPVAWSLGNFVWPNLSRESSTTAVARVVVAPDGGIEACLVPAFISSPGRPEITGDPTC